MKRVWFALALAAFLVGCSSVQTVKRAEPVQQVQSPTPAATAPHEPVVHQENGHSFISSVSPSQQTVTKATETAEIQVHFTRDMNPGTLNKETIQVVEAKHSRILTDDYYFEYRDKTLVLRPVNPAFDFGSDNTVTVTIKGTVQDATGQSMGKDFSWSFRT